MIRPPRIPDRSCDLALRRNEDLADRIHKLAKSDTIRWVLRLRKGAKINGLNAGLGWHK